MDRNHSSRGFSLMELLVVLAIIGLATTIACNSMINAARRAALRSAAISLAQAMEGVRFDSYGNTRNRGLRFFPTASGRWQYAVYQDNDGDGVLNADILKGIDPLVDGPYPLTDQLLIATIGVPAPSVKHPDTGKPFPQTASAINFNQSSICSFSPNGDATPGTIYLVNGNPREAAMVRSSGKGGTIRARFYGLRGSGWQP